MKNLEKNIWKIDESSRISRVAWDWWWWLIFLPEKNSKKTKQLMILWSTKKCKKISVNDLWWERKGSLERTPEGAKFGGIIAAWYFDGEKMITPLILEEHEIFLKQGKIEDSGHKFIMEGNGQFSLKIDTGNRKFILKTENWTKFLSKERLTKEIYFGRNIYENLKIYGRKISGKIIENGKGKKASGTAYFQRVNVNAPPIPWCWGMFHCSEGSFIEYFASQIGLPCLKRTGMHESIFNNGEISLKKKLHFFHEPTKKHYKFSNFALKKIVDGELPTFLITASQKGKSLRMKLKTYSRVCWSFSQPLIRDFATKLFYNEYPTSLEEFELRDGKKIITRGDLGRASGNSEFSWGVLF